MSGPFDKELESILQQHTQDFARKLAHEIQAHVLRKLGIGATAPSSPPRAAEPKKAAPKKAAPKAAPVAPKAAPAKKAAPAATTKPRASSDDKASIVDKVFRIVSSKDGVAVGEVVRVSGFERASAAAALKALKEEGRIFMGGSRRFARYATSQAAADRASETARKGG